jgi:lipopolysaccharide/colanic/teichoic acid biosynthesis glycosyltransferase
VNAEVFTSVEKTVARDAARPVLDPAFLFSMVLAALLIVFLAPLMICVALAVRLQDGGPVLFAQKRVGYGGRTFACLKFRSMAVDAEARLERLLAEDLFARAEWASDHKLRIDPRITPVGMFLRRSSLDELPQLFNVLRGEMDLVGPRPIVPSEVGGYGRRIHHYCAVRPGITGLWRISGRTDISYRRRVAIDTVYARSKDFTFDLKILALTLPAVLFQRGSY